MKKALFLACLLSGITMAIEDTGATYIENSTSVEMSNYGNQTKIDGVRFQSVYDDQKLDADEIGYPLPSAGTNGAYLLDDHNNFSMVFDMDSFSISENAIENDEIPSSVVNFGTSESSLGVGLNYNGTNFMWYIWDSYSGKYAIGEEFTGAEGQYVFRSGEGIIDLWYIGEESTTLLVALESTVPYYVFSYQQNRDNTTGEWVDSEWNDDIFIGDEHSSFMRGKVNSVALYNGMYTENGVGGGNLNIPEPSAATLSLLAFVGLAARRRRR